MECLYSIISSYLRQHSEVKLLLQFSFVFTGIPLFRISPTICIPIFFQQIFRPFHFFISNKMKNLLLRFPVGIFLTAQVTLIVLSPHAQPL